MCAQTSAHAASKRAPAKTGKTATAPAPASADAGDSLPQLISTTGGRGGDDAGPAKKWPDPAALKKAADAGDPDACYELGNRFLNGSDDTPKSVARAMLYFQDAARKGHRDAHFRLGKLYSDGDQTPQDHAKALAHYTAAARAGHALAQHNLGAMHASGRGVKTNYAEGLAWLIIAAHHDPEAVAGEKKLRDFLASINRPDQVSAGETRALELTQEIAIAKITLPAMTPGATSPAIKIEPIKPAPIQMTAPEMSPPAFTPMALPELPPPPLPQPAASGTGAGAKKK